MGSCVDPGPPNFVQWRRCWRAFAVAMEMLGLRRAAALQAYDEHIRALDAEYPRDWGIIAAADVMHSEQWTTYLRTTESAIRSGHLCGLSTVTTPAEASLPAWSTRGWSRPFSGV